ncbi:MAG: zinc ribbon domain-containing protein [Thermoplasmata archaeon]|nr:zinc ribbon domain-containing protein [Thermoplasmata archaeon]
MEGPDEDAFTLAVAALERLIEGASASFPSGFDQLDLVGDFPAEIDAELGTAMGWGEAEIRHHPPGIESFAQACRNAAAGEGPSGSAVVTVDALGEGDRATPTRDAAAIAAGFVAGPGARLAGASSRRHPPEQRPEAARWVAAARRAAPHATAATQGTLGLLSTAAPPVLLIEWNRSFPLARTEHLAWTPTPTAPSPSAAMAVAVYTGLRAAAVGETAWAAVIRPERTDFLAFEVEGPVTWLGPFSQAEGGRPLPEVRPTGRGTWGLESVSQGAYVARARYLENLPARWRFAAERCPSCATVTFPPRGRCRRCATTTGLERVELPREHLEVEAVTVVAPGAQPAEFDGQVAAMGSYGVVLARLAPGVRATLQVTDTDPHGIKVGDRVRAVLRRIYPMEGAWRYGRKAVGEEPVSAPAKSG